MLAPQVAGQDPAHLVVVDQAFLAYEVPSVAVVLPHLGRCEPRCSEKVPRPVETADVLEPREVSEEALPLL